MSDRCVNTFFLFSGQELSCTVLITFGDPWDNVPFCSSFEIFNSDCDKIVCTCSRSGNDIVVEFNGVDDGVVVIIDNSGIKLR